jgi:hypothetical protein
MSINFDSILSPSEKRQIIEKRMAQFASDAYQYELNLKTAEVVGSEEQTEAIRKSLSVLETAIKIHQDELAALPKED